MAQVAGCGEIPEGGFSDSPFGKNVPAFVSYGGKYCIPAQGYQIYQNKGLAFVSYGSCLFHGGYCFFYQEYAACADDETGAVFCRNGAWICRHEYYHVLFYAGRCQTGVPSP